MGVTSKNGAGSWRGAEVIPEAAEKVLIKDYEDKLSFFSSNESFIIRPGECIKNVNRVYFETLKQL